MLKYCTWFVFVSLVVTTLKTQCNNIVRAQKARFLIVNDSKYFCVSFFFFSLFNFHIDIGYIAVWLKTQPGTNSNKIIRTKEEEEKKARNIQLYDFVECIAVGCKS